MERGRGFCFCFFVLLFSLVFRACFLFLQITKKRKTKTNFFFPHNEIRSWLAYPESLHFQIFSLFLICRDHTRCTAKSIRSREDKKKKLSLTVSDSPRSRKVHGKEHTQPGNGTVRD